MRLSFVALALGAGLAACASGGGGGSQSTAPIRALLSGDSMMFVSFDGDGDLNVSTAEVDAGMNREFTRADTNGDGTMTPIEFQAWANAVIGGGHIGPYRLDFDRNVDNSITRQEFDTEIRARADEYDENDDGLISRGEMVRLVGQTRTPTRRRIQAPRPGG